MADDKGKAGQQPSLSELAEAAGEAWRQWRDSHNARHGHEYPFWVLDGIHWEFGPDNADLTFAEIVDRLRLRDEEWAREDGNPPPQPWDHQRVIVRMPRVIVLYWSDEPTGSSSPVYETHFHLAELRSDNGQHFTEGELFFKLYQAAAPVLRESVHCRLEYLEFVTTLWGGEGMVPLYQMSLND